MTAWSELMVERGTCIGLPMRPQVVAPELEKLIRNDAIIFPDSGPITT